MARKPQDIKIVVHKPQAVRQVFWNEETEKFWQEVMERRIADNHMDVSLLKQALYEQETGIRQPL